MPISEAPPELAGLRIVHVSDFHFRSWTRVIEAAQQLLLMLDYDLLVATGDFGTIRERWIRVAEVTRRFFEPIAKRVPVYAVLGNHDHPRLASAPDMPLEFLSNRSVLIDKAGTTFELAGVDQSLPGAEDLVAALGNGRRHGFTMLLAHYPSTVFRLPPGRVDLQLSGHTHGGQIRLPRLGCLWTNDRIARRMSRGLHVVGGTVLHVNSGIGVAAPFLVRVNCLPEVTVLTLKPADRKPPSRRPRELAITNARGPS
ncbi:MAG: metallophosphoesterase [Phycisphaerae bacterium]